MPDTSSGLTVSDVESTAPLPVAPAPEKPVTMPPPNPAPVAAAPAIIPLKPPPTDHHQLSAGLSTELGETAKSALEKINKNFETLFNMLTGTKPVSASGAKPDTPAGGLTSEASGLIGALNKRIAALENGAETVAKTAFDDVLAKVEALETSLKNMVSKADYEALKNRFATLETKLVHALGLDPPAAPPPA